MQAIMLTTIVKTGRTCTIKLLTQTIIITIICKIISPINICLFSQIQDNYLTYSAEKCMHKLCIAGIR